MVFDLVVERFMRRRPVCLLARMALARLLSESALDQVFRDNASAQYERSVLFSSLTKMMAEVVLREVPSVHSAYKKNKESLGASLTAVCNKLDRVEPQVTRALVRFSYEQTRLISTQLEASEANWVAGYQTKILDGNHLRGTQHRLKELRAEKAAALPGKALVILDPQVRAIQDCFPIEDGHAQERSALDEVIETIEARDLWIADRNFCTHKFLYSIDHRDAAFVVRHHEQVIGSVDETRQYVGETEKGQVFERVMELSPHEGRQLTVRRIEVDLNKPTRDKQKTVVILTNLSQDKADALQIADLYLQRWDIEKVFQTLTVTLRCEVSTLGYPRAALFAFAVALVAYNAVIIIEAALRAAHGKEQADQLSKYYMALEIAQAHDGLMVMLEESDFEYLRTLPLKQYVEELLEVARHVSIEHYRKTTRGPKKPVNKKLTDKNQLHYSTARIIAQRKQ